MAATAKARSIDALPESGTVTVACNVPNGLVLKLYDFEEHSEPVLGGGTKTVKVAVLRAEIDPVTINGPRYDKSGNTPPYVLTFNVEAQFMAEWMRQNVQSDLVKNRCIIVHRDKASAKAEARELEKNRSGLEPLDGGVDDKGKPNDLRIPRPMKTAIGSIGAIDQMEREG